MSKTKTTKVIMTPARSGGKTAAAKAAVAGKPNVREAGPTKKTKPGAKA